MAINPIISSLRRHKLTGAMLILQVALTCAVVTNVMSIVSLRIGASNISTGVSEKNLSVIKTEEIGGDPNLNSFQEDLIALKRIAGMDSVVRVNSVPLSKNDESYAVCPDLDAFQRATAAMSLTHSGCILVSAFEGTQGLLKTFGSKLIAGRDFLPSEFEAGQAHVAIIAKEVADKLYPGKVAVGRTMYQGEHPVKIIGVVDRLVQPRFTEGGKSGMTMLYPVIPSGSTSIYLLRSTHQDQYKILRQAARTLAALNNNRLIPAEDMKTFEDIREAYFHNDRVMALQLSGAALALVAVTAFGLAGLSSFWVEQRRRTIGIRRALGASAPSIRRYFQLENVLIVFIGLIAGACLSYGLGLVLFDRYNEPIFDPLWLLASAAVIAVTGHFSALGPALRASRVSPASVLVSS